MELFAAIKALSNFNKKKSFKIIVTGGFSYLFKNSLKTKVKVDRDITINGLIRATNLIKYNK